MAKSLVIVESPAKAKTISKILGQDYTVKASIGHVRDLPKNKLGVNVRKNFEPQYEILREKEPIVKELQEAAKLADKVYLAPDPDREGEAIAWHLSEILDLPSKKVHRVEFNEITKEAVLAAMKKPRQIDQSLVDAQQARRLLDRLVGYKISPLLWRKVNGRSAGRVQSVAVRIICEREEEIEAFDPQEYWSVHAELSKARSKNSFLMHLVKWDGKRVIAASDKATAGSMIVDSEKLAKKITKSDTTEENIQARLRGMILMALSNKFGYLVLTTGNKSELAVGYCTLYGDMCGGLAVISDVPKTMVYDLARYINELEGRQIIPSSTIEKPPSAELRPGQKDQDSLPPYVVLDGIIHAYVEQRMSADQIVKLGYKPEVVMDVIDRIDKNEYKRYQAAPGLKVTARSFGSGWRMPIAQGFKERLNQSDLIC